MNLMGSQSAFALPPSVDDLGSAIKSSKFASDDDVVNAFDTLRYASSKSDANTAIMKIRDYVGNHPMQSVLSSKETKDLLNRLVDVYQEINGKSETSLTRCIVEPVVNLNDCFDLLSGMDKEKDEMRSAFQYPRMFPNLFRFPTRGILLYGPPGTGKTSLARAAVGEFTKDVLFFNITPGTIRGPFVGDVEKNLKNVFECAHDKLDADPNVQCVLFFDEFEALAMDRANTVGGRDSRAVPMLLQLIQGITPVSSRLSLIAATNLLHQVDPAVQRRFPTQIFVDMPNYNARLQMIYTNLAKMFTIPNQRLCQTVLLQDESGKVKIQIITEYDDGKRISTTEPEFLYHLALFGDDVYPQQQILPIAQKVKFWKTELEKLAVLLGPKDGKLLVSKRKESGGQTVVGYSSSDITSLIEYVVKKDAVRWVCRGSDAYFVAAQFRRCPGPVIENQEPDDCGEWSDTFYVGTRRSIDSIRRDIKLLHDSYSPWLHKVRIVDETRFSCSTLPKDSGDRVLSFGVTIDDLRDAIQHTPPTLKTLADYMKYTATDVKQTSTV